MKKKAKKVAKKVTKKRQPKPQTLRGILNGLDDILSGPDMGLASQLWDVLSALRGPDTKNSGHTEVKEATTAVIRRIAFPITAVENQNLIPAVFSRDSQSSLTTREGRLDILTSWHFEHHAKQAFNALGLNWLGLN